MPLFKRRHFREFYVCASVYLLINCIPLGHFEILEYFQVTVNVQQNFVIYYKHHAHMDSPFRGLYTKAQLMIHPCIPPKTFHCFPKQKTLLPPEYKDRLFTIATSLRGRGTEKKNPIWGKLGLLNPCPNTAYMYYYGCL